MADRNLRQQGMPVHDVGIGAGERNLLQPDRQVVRCFGAVAQKTGETRAMFKQSVEDNGIVTPVRGMALMIMLRAACLSMTCRGTVMIAGVTRG